LAFSSIVKYQFETIFRSAFAHRYWAVFDTLQKLAVRVGDSIEEMLGWGE